jgi:hypothetical protein
VTVCVTPPLVPVMVIVYVPAGVLLKVLTVKVSVPDPFEVSETLLELRLSLGPWFPPVGKQVADMETVPTNPLRLARLIVMVPLLPAVRLNELTSVLRVKS